MKLQLKLILIFIVLKILPLAMIALVAIEGTKSLGVNFENAFNLLFNKSEHIISETATKTINDVVVALDEKSQDSIEKLTVFIANEVADFLYERDKDLLFLANLENINQEILDSFYISKTKYITVHNKYVYDDNLSQWILEIKTEKDKKLDLNILDDNKKEFNKLQALEFNKKEIPIYKEITFFNTKGVEIYKTSSIDLNLKDISKKENRYLNAETYFEEISHLRQGEIYVSNVIGEYVRSKIIGRFTKEKTKKANIAFEPNKHAYAGLENPVGKKFDGIVRFITPYYKDEQLVGYISLALDHRHIMEYTDYVKPTDSFLNDISDAGSGNYAFMWDNLGRSISHPRDYFIVGYDKNSGEVVKPWLGEDIESKYKSSGIKNINDFLKTVTPYENQSLKIKPNVAQIKDGEIALDCRYLSFAPQCHGWIELVKDGGYGSFIIFWSGVWKLTTASAIPYYTGSYGKNKIGFGFVTIGANVDEFHKAATSARDSVEKVLNTQKTSMTTIVEKTKNSLIGNIKSMINEITIITLILVFLVIFIAILLSKSITKQINILINGTREFAKNNFDFTIKINSKDEFGELADSFNKMSYSISNYIKNEKNQNIYLESKVNEAVNKIREQDALILKQSRHAVMGEMINNIAHQWRQPLNALSTIVYKIKKFNANSELLSKEEKNETFEKANHLIKYMSKTIDDFRNYLEPNKEKSEFLLKEIVESSFSIVSSSLTSRNIEVIIDINKDLKCFGYQNEFAQVILNFISNSKYAIKENNSEIKIIKVYALTEDEYILLNFEDSGGGIKKEAMNKIFDPYFTTKDSHNGTGIGLYMSKQIVEKSLDGELTARNGEKGAIFTIKLKKF